MKYNKLYIRFAITLALTISSSTYAESTAHKKQEQTEPAEIAIGERLFLETRFAQAYYADPGKADPILNKTILLNNTIKGSFAGKTINCRSCHMVDEHATNPMAGMRSYSDFAKRPPVPRRKDQALTSGRNSMSMVNIAIPRQHGTVFHFDGEFNSMEDLVRATLTRRNFGWLPGEADIAIKHIARVIREDNGMDELAQESGGSYRKVLAGTAKDLPESLRLPANYRINVDAASDQDILNAVAKLVSAYVLDLNFARDESGVYAGSPYDAFLKLNKLPRKENKNETLNEYSQRLLRDVETLKNPQFVESSTTNFKSHNQKFVFSEKELQGMKLFFRKGSNKTSGGNCISCHSAPHFSDFGFHNTSLAQQNYDSLHGNGKFMQLKIPALKERNKNYNNFLPATLLHPHASSQFRSIATKEKPGYTDLGLWNVFANPDMPKPQEKLKNILCAQIKAENLNDKTQTNCSDEALLQTSIAAFKTPLLRDLGHSNPYMHSGQFTSLEQVIQFYISASVLAKNNLLRNPEASLKEVNLENKDIDALVAFLKSLNEDYD